MAATDAAAHRVLIVESDPRVRDALIEFINATHHLAVVAAVSSVAEVEAAHKADSPDVAIVEICAEDAANDFARIRALAEHLPVVAVGAVGSLRLKTVAAGAVVFREMDGDSDGLIAAVHGAAHGSPDGALPADEPDRHTTSYQ